MGFELDDVYNGLLYHRTGSEPIYDLCLEWLQEEDLHLEHVYYSEMKDAGFFDSDWEWYNWWCPNHEIIQVIPLCK